MSALRLNVIKTTGELRRIAPAWDDLWQRSAVTMPFARAHFVADWLQHFAGRHDFCALTVETQSQLVAALPLVARRLGRFYTAGSVPDNKWSPAGDLLIDESDPTAEILDCLAAGLNKTPWSMLWFDGVLGAASRWQNFRSAIQRQGFDAEWIPQFQVGWIPTQGDWNAFQHSWSKNHRRHMNRCRRRLHEAALTETKVYHQLSSEQITQRMRDGFTVEDRSWKGTAGTSTLRCNGMFDYYVHQAQRLAKSDQLALVFLEHDNFPIAFEYGLMAKGIYHSFKVGYDAQYAKYSPGQVLMGDLLEIGYRDAMYQAIDCMGPMSGAVARWKPENYTVGRLIAASSRGVSQLLLDGYRHLWPFVRKWRDKKADTLCDEDVNKLGENSLTKIGRL